MQRVDDWFVLAGALYGALGMALGLWMGMAHQPGFTGTHAHVLLAGFVAFLVYGLVYRAWPALKASWMGMAHFVLAMLGTPPMLVGSLLMNIDGEPNMLLVIGSFAAFLASVAFLANMLRLVAREPLP